MNYLYGNSTPFPLQQDFLATLRALTDACVGLLQVDEAIGAAHASAQQAEAEAARDLEWLSGLGEAILSAIKGYDQRPASATAAREAQRLAGAAENLVSSARSGIGGRREQLVGDLQSRIAEQRRVAARALERFLLKHTLPNSLWGMTWRVDTLESAAVQAEAACTAPCQLEAGFRLEVPPTSAWSKPVKVGDLVSELYVELPTKKGRLRRQALSKLLIAGVELSPQQTIVALRRRQRETAHGIEFSRREDTAELSVRAFDQNGNPEEPLRLDGPDAEPVRQLMNEISNALGPLIEQRIGLTEVTFKGGPAVDKPGELAVTLIETAAPYVRSIVERSASPNELCLKRDIGDHRREELFLPASEITNKFAVLSARQQSFFDGFGLPKGQADTAEPAQSTSTTGEIAIQSETLAGGIEAAASIELESEPALDNIDPEAAAVVESALRDEDFVEQELSSDEIDDDVEPEVVALVEESEVFEERALPEQRTVSGEVRARAPSAEVEVASHKL